MSTKTRTVRARSPQAALFGGGAVAEAPLAPAPPRPSRTARTAENADSMAARQRDISIAEFFTKNRHLLGFDNPQKALLTAVKEAVDNSLDACEEAGILPDLDVEIHEISESRYRIAIEDNGPGIVRQQIPKIFGKLLYGSKFHRLKQQRGQQGIGISAAGMYGVLTTGKPVRVISRVGRNKPAHLFEIAIDTQKNAPVVHKDVEIDWLREHGTRVEIEIEAVYKKGRRSVDDYVEQTALANPHVRLKYVAPKEEPRIYDRVTQELPVESKEIKPHPYGIELGILLKMLKETEGRTVRAALQSDFSRVSLSVADEICSVAGVSPDTKPAKLSPAQVEAVFRSIPKVKIMAPPTACLSPIGEDLLEKGLATRVQADFVTAVTRPPAVYRGNPFQVEVGLAYGGGLPGDELIEVFRFANRVPLQYQQSACAIFKSGLAVDWKNYGLQQSKGALPTGPMILFVHIASVWVPFTSESKEAVASYPEIVKELRLALMEAGRRLGSFVRHRRRVADEEKKRSYIEKYIPHIGDALQQILGFNDAHKKRTIEDLKTILERTRKL
ncbi:MAG TPA: DNA topoisomerase VI subunit B [Candidatus Polarisedimenticolaceae bacterium]